jgi:hypothetical protein
VAFNHHGSRWILVSALTWLASTLAALASATAAPAATMARTNTNTNLAAPTVLVIVGAPGEEEFGRNFLTWAGFWEKSAAQAAANYVAIGIATNQPGDDRDRVRETLAVQATNQASELWLVLLGHGTFDGKEARFNLRGPDFAATEMGDWVKGMTKPLVFIDASSSSGPFLTKLSAPGRAIITATRSGHEANYARFGQHLSESIVDVAADLDKDGQTSLLEAFLMASRRVAEFYKSEGRLATEHPLLDDNGDGLGTPPDWFRGVRAIKAAKNGAPLDGLRAHQFHLVHNDEDKKLSPESRARRDALERSIARLRDEKKDLAEDVYYAKLEAMLLELARLYDQTGRSPATNASPGSVRP